MTSRSDALRNVIPLRIPGATSVADKVRAGEDLTLQDKIFVYQTMSRVWRRHLTANEIVAMSYIVDRTAGWGKDSFTAMTANVLEGTDEFAGVGLARRTYYETLASLEAKGLIRRQSLRDKTKITLNMGWTPEKSAMIPVPKRLKDGQECTNRTSKSAGTAQQECAIRTQNTVVGTTNSKDLAAVEDDLAEQWGTPKAELSPETEKADGFPRRPKIEQPFLPLVQPVASGVVIKVRERISQHQAEAVARRADQAEESIRAGKPITSTDIEAIWRHALAEVHPLSLHVTWALKERGMVKQAMKKWTHAKSGTFASFVDYAVRNWSVIIKRKLAWMNSPKAPIYPSISFLIWRLNDFVEAWASDAAKGFVQKSDNDAYKRLIVSGMSHEDAIKELARRDAVTATRDEMDKREQKVRQREKTAAMREERAGRLEHLGEKGLDLPDGQRLEVTPGTARRPGQVWGHQPIIKVQPVAAKVETVHDTTAKPIAPPDALTLPTWDEVQKRVASGEIKPFFVAEGRRVEK